MKILKLIFIFVAIVGGLILAINWESLFNDSNSDDNFPSEDKLDITIECDRIRKGWNAATEWNEQLYNDQRADIDQSKSMHLFSKEGYNTVNNTLRETATNKACDTYMEELKKKDASSNRLVHHYRGVTTIEKAEKLENDPRISRVKSIHKLYSKIRDFSNSSHTISPKFDEDSKRWSSFVSLQNVVLNTARSYKGNALYKEVKHISGFEKALDESHLREIMSSQKASFYKELSKQIIAYFDDAEPTEENKALYNQIYTDFSQEDNVHGINELANSVVEFKNKETKK